MLKTNKKTLILTSIVTLLPILVGVLLWNRLPDVMATHFGMSNEANGFSSKAFAVFGLPLFMLAMLWFCAVITSNDPRKQNISPKVFTLVLWIIPVVSLICSAIIYTYNLGYNWNITFVMELFTGILFIIIGNYLPKSRQNYTVGIKLPWTLADEDNWNRTHRLGGFLWVICGILLIVMTLTGFKTEIFLFGIIIAAAVVPCIYSYLLYKKKGE